MTGFAHRITTLLPAVEGRARLAALVLGGLAATGFAPLGLWPVAIVAIALLLHLLDTAATAGRAFQTGWLFGLGHFIVGLNWIAEAFMYQAAMPVWLGWVAVVLLSLYLALFPALAALATHLALGRLPAGQGRPLVLGLLFAASWIVTEWLRSWLFTGFAWNPLAALLPAAAAPTRWVGTYGQSGLLILAAAALLLIGRRHWRAGAAVGGGVLLAIIGATAAVSLDGPAVATGSDGQATAPHVTIVQPNIDQGDKWDRTQKLVNFQKLARLSISATPGRPRLLLWPEAAVPDYLEAGYPPDWYDDDPAIIRARLASLLGDGDLLLTGAVRLETNARGSDVVGARNSLFVLDAEGRLGPRYDKAHLVPYGEYLPLRTVLEPLGLSRLAPGAVDFWPGPGPRTLDLGRFGRAGVQICYEIIFSGHVADRADRPDFIFNPSNDAWFGGWGPPQHLAQARLRAMEEGLPVLRATPTGISAIIAADGRIIDQLPMYAAGRIDAAIPPAAAPTLFSRYGNRLPLILAGVLGLLGVAFARQRKYGRAP